MDEHIAGCPDCYEVFAETVQFGLREEKDAGVTRRGTPAALFAFGRRPGFKMGLQVVGDRWYLYLAHLWHRGWSVLDITKPEAPQLVRSIDGPSNTWTIQVQVAGGRMITSLEKIDSGWGDDPTAPGKNILLNITTATKNGVIDTFWDRVDAAP